MKNTEMIYNDWNWCFGLSNIDEFTEFIKFIKVIQWNQVPVSHHFLPETMPKAFSCPLSDVFSQHSCFVSWYEKNLHSLNRLHSLKQASAEYEMNGDTGASPPRTLSLLLKLISFRKQHFLPEIVPIICPLPLSDFFSQQNCVSLWYEKK